MPLTFKYPNPLGLEARGLKTFNGMEGRGYNATIYCAGRKMIELIDDATGGELMINPVGKEGEAIVAKLKSLCATLPKENTFGVELPVTMDIWFEELVNDVLLERKLDRARKSATLFVLKGENVRDGYRTVKAPTREQAVAFLTKKYGAEGFALV